MLWNGIIETRAVFHNMQFINFIGMYTQMLDRCYVKDRSLRGLCRSSVFWLILFIKLRCLIVQYAYFGVGIQ